MKQRIAHFALRVGALAHKETLHMLRDRQVIYLALGMPLVMVLLFGYAISFDVSEIPVAAVDQDRSPASRRLLRAFDASDAFVVARRAERVAEAEALFRGNAAKAAIVIPPGFGRRLARGERAPFQLLVDGADGTTARVALGYAEGLSQAQTARLIQGAARRAALPLLARVRTLFNPRMESALFVVPGLAAIVLAIISVLLSTITVAREWERGSMEQLFATPVGRLSVVLGKLLPYVGLGMLQLLLVLVAGCWLFDVPVRGNVGLLLAAATLFLVCSLGQGLLISVVTKSQQVATQIGMVSSLLPSLLLSGFIFPIDNMPALLRWISHVVPTRYMIVCLRGILLQARGLEQLWPQLLGLGILAVAIVFACTARFRRRLD